MAIVRSLPSCRFDEIAPEGVTILAALCRAAPALAVSAIYITSACDGAHSGPEDPHHFGRAYDLRTHNLTPSDKVLLVGWLKRQLGADYTAFVESPDQPNEHIHVQARAGVTMNAALAGAPVVALTPAVEEGAS